MRNPKWKLFLSKAAFAVTALLLFAMMPAVCVGAQTAEETTAILLDKYSSLDTKSTDAATGMVSGTFKAEAEALSGVTSHMHKIVCPADGYYRINYSAAFHGEKGITRDYDNNSMGLTLYANETGTKVIVDPLVLGLGAETSDRFVELSKGTYYLLAEPKINKKEKNIDTVYAVSFGYLPQDTSFIHVEKKVDKEARKVLLTVTGPDAEDIRIKPGKNQNLIGVLWDGLDAVGNGGVFTITEGSDDGYYTIRMEDTYSNVYGLSVLVNEFDTPSVPQIKRYQSGTSVVSGTASPGCKVQVQVAGDTYSGTADAKGAWKVNTASLKVGTKISAQAESAFGVKSGQLSVTVKNRSFAKPKVKSAKKNTKKISGTTKGNCTVYVKIGKKTYKAKANAKGKFTVKTCKLKKKMKVTVYAKDSAKNTSKKAKHTVK